MDSPNIQNPLNRSHPQFKYKKEKNWRKNLNPENSEADILQPLDP